MMKDILDKPGPILLLGLATRTGTTHLQHLIAAHPDCYTPPSQDAQRPEEGDNRPYMGEDFFLYEAHLLEPYLDALLGKKKAGIEHRHADELWAHVGEGLLTFARGESTAPRLVLKTPSVRGVEYAARMFPAATVVVILRDPRDAVASVTMSWDYSDFDAACERLARNAWLVRNALDDPRVSIDVLVRFERLVVSPEEVMRGVLDRVNLDAVTYPWEELETAPVRGTYSNFREHKTKPFPKAPGFNPIGRWRSWEPERCQKFEEMCGEATRVIGYPMDEPEWKAKL